MKLTPFVKTIAFLFICLSANHVFSQISFEPNYDIVSTEGYRSGLPNAMADVNGDGRDDLVRMTSRHVLEVNFGSGNTTELKLTEFDASLPTDAWNITIGNLDNKGPNEIALGTVYKGGYIFTYNEKTQALELLQTTARDFYSQGSNFVDINNDGNLDWFVCDDESHNEIFLNDGTGNLVESDDFIDMSSKIKSDNSGNYASDWVDIDSDGDLDCYISKCRSAAKEDTDPRRINQLFINDGNNNFTDKADEFNIDFGTQTWATNFGDLDNDGDLDAIIINHGDKWNLLENIDNETFVDHPELIQQLQGFAVQCILRDFDNNGYLDILVTGRSDFMWFNYGDFNFEIVREPFRYFTATNFTVGDINHDGFTDAYVTHTNGYNDPGYVDDMLYLNQKNDNHWVGLRLNGKVSNSCGIGARIRAYTPNLGWQIRDVRSGESYGIMNSLNQIFGLGEEETIEQLEVTWPSGQVDKFYDIDAGKYYTITEGICISADEELAVVDNGILCDNSQLKLEGKENMLNVWSTGEELESIQIAEDGIYALDMINQQGCVTKAPAAYVRSVEDFSTENVIDVDNDVTCFGAQLNINTPLAKDIRWSTGESNRSIYAIESAVYEAIITDHCDNEFTVAAEVVVLDPTPKNILGDTVGPGGTAQLNAEGDYLKWYNTETEDKEIETGNTLEVIDPKESMTFYVQGERTQTFESEYTGESEWKGTSRYGDYDLNGGMYFEVKEDIVLESVEVITDTVGVRTFQILDEDKEVLFTKDIDLVFGKNILELNVTLPPANRYLLTTEVNKNFQTFGHYGPRLERSNTETKYPYRTSDLLWITDSAFGAQYMHYFYNWKLKKADLHCVSDRIPVQLLFDINSSTSESEELKISIYPNPTNGLLTVEHLYSSVPYQLTVFDMHGAAIVVESDVKEHITSIDLSEVPSGVYTVLFESIEGLSIAKRLIKVD